MGILDRIVIIGIEVYFWMIFIYVLSSWIPNLRESQFGYTLGRLVEPYLSFFRRFIPPIGMLDISPIVALIALRFIGQGILVVLSWIF